MILKKLGFGLIGLIIVASIYYFASGSTQLTSKIKAQVDSELANIQTQGFSIQGRVLNKEKEHFIISLDEPQKLATFFTENGIQLSAADAEILKGLKVGVDLQYLPDAYSAVTIDMYPMALPAAMIEVAQTKEDKKILAQIEKMLKKKIFLMHFAVNKIGTGFKGYIKDIDETIQGDENIKMLLSKLEFSGDIKDNKIEGMKQTLKELGIDVGNKFTMTMHNLKSDYKMTGATQYDYIANYSIEKMTTKADDELNVLLNDFELSSDSTVKDGLSSGVLKTKTKNIIIDKKGGKLILNNIVFEMKAANLDVKAFEQLDQIDVENEKEINMVLQQLISQGISFEIPTFSIDNIENSGQKIGGFLLTSMLKIDKSLNVAAVQSNPLAAVNALNAKIDFSLSEELFAELEKQPEAIMAMMLFQPKNVNGKKIYKIELKDGKLSVNGKQAM